MLRAPGRACIIASLATMAACASPPAPTRQLIDVGYRPSAPLPGAITVSFALPRGPSPAPFWSLPWPSVLSRAADGHSDFRAFPGVDSSVFGAYVATAARDVEGASVSPSIYFHFSAPLVDPRLPTDPRAYAAATAPVFLVDVDATSPERGTFHALAHRYYDADLRFVPKNTLALKPAPGDVLRPGTLYAAVVRRDLVPGGLGTTMDLEAVKWTDARDDPVEEDARKLHQAALDQLAAAGVNRDSVAAIALFRTQVPHALTARLLTTAMHLPPGRAPRILEARWVDRLAKTTGDASYATIEGVYCTPSFQEAIERAPFIDEDGGRIRTDASGTPMLAPVPASGTYGSGECDGLLRARFVLTVPDRPMPAQGFPLLVTAHGTGGDAESFLGVNNFAGWAARQGIAALSTDQPLHGGRGPAPRPGSREPIAISIAGIPVTLDSGPHAAEEAFYNPIHPAAARDNLRQAAVDASVLAHLFVDTDFTTLSRAGRPILAGAKPGPRFDRNRVIAAGHSQGAHSIAVVAALDPLFRAAILSGCGGDARVGVLGRDDIPIVPIFRALLGLMPGELDEMHPLMALVQTLADPIDPASYARFYWEAGARPLPSVLHYEGMGDRFSPPASAEILAIALHATPVAPVLRALPSLRASEPSLDILIERAGPVRAFVQTEPTRGEDGHFVLFREPSANGIAMDFMRAMVR